MATNCSDSLKRLSPSETGGGGIGGRCEDAEANISGKLAPDRNCAFAYRPDGLMGQKSEAGISGFTTTPCGVPGWGGGAFPRGSYPHLSVRPSWEVPRVRAGVGEAVLRSGRSQAHLHRVPRGPAPTQPPWEKSPGRPPPPRSLCGTARAPSPQPALHDAGPRAQRRLWNWLDRAGGCVASRSAQATEFVHFKTGSFPVV